MQRYTVNWATDGSGQVILPRQCGLPALIVFILPRWVPVVVTAVCTRYVPGASRDGPCAIGAHAIRRSLTIPRSQSHGRPCAVMCTRRITCADAVVKRAFDGSCWRSLLQSCYTVELGTGWFTDVSLR